MYSFHSSPEEKNKLLYTLTQHGIDTTVDRVAKKKRIRDWIQESIIDEEDDEEEEEEEEVRPATRAPVPGHVSSVQAQEKAARSQIVTTVKDSSQKHINPRTGKVQLGPSEMGHHTDSHGPSTHHNDTPQSTHHNQEKTHERSNYTNQMDGIEMRRDNNDYDYPVVRRSTKLVDVGSQTSSESQKQLEAARSSRTYTPERPVSIGDVYASKNSHSVPVVPPHAPVPPPHSHNKTQNTQTNLSRMDTTQRGFMTAFNSLATTEIQQNQPLVLQPLQPVTSRNRDREHRERSQPRQSYQQRHNTTTLTKQPISRSVHNFNSLVNDSGYGSLDKLRSNDAGNNTMASPTFSKRSIIQSKLVTNAPANGSGVSGNDIIHINGLSHAQNESNSPFNSDSGGDGSPRGSNGFVNYVGVSTPPQPPTRHNETNNRRMSMKDTAYDRVRSNRKRR